MSRNRNAEVSSVVEPDEMQDGDGAVAVVPAGTVEAMERANIDVQISTAKKYPRSLQTFKKRSTEMATLDKATAESCIYYRPVGKKQKTGQQKFVQGLSVRMAEIVAACYGNIRVGSMLVEIEPNFVKARGFAHDLESNSAASSEVVESIIDSNGNRYSERMIMVVAKACLAKARRDATFQVVPKALCREPELAARKVISGDRRTMDEGRKNAMDWISSLKIDTARVFAALGIAGEADIGVEVLTKLAGIKTAIGDKDVTVDEAFPPIETVSRPQTVGGGAEKPPEKKDAPPPAAKTGGSKLRQVKAPVHGERPANNPPIPGIDTP